VKVGSRRGGGPRRRGTVVLAAWASALALAGGAGAALARSPKPAIHTVTIDATSYQPARLAVHVGDTIVWANKDLFPHTVTATARAFDSDVLVNGKSWRFVAKRKGTFDYACVFHPVMKGQLTVE
jgi:plastocyanin